MRERLTDEQVSRRGLLHNDGRGSHALCIAAGLAYKNSAVCVEVHSCAPVAEVVPDLRAQEQEHAFNAQEEPVNCGAKRSFKIC